VEPVVLEWGLSFWKLWYFVLGSVLSLGRRFVWWAVCRFVYFVCWLKQFLGAPQVELGLQLSDQPCGSETRHTAAAEPSPIASSGGPLRPSDRKRLS
jgi:hypothetical protein